MKLLKDKLARIDKEIEKLKTKILSVLAPSNDLVEQCPKEKQHGQRKPSQNPGGEPHSKNPHVTPSPEDQPEYSPASLTAMGFLDGPPSKYA